MIEVYTDWACHPNPWEWGWCAIILHNWIEEVVSWWANYTTNNRMETMAVFQALHLIGQYYPATWTFVKLYTDSMYVVHGMNKLLQKKWLPKTNTDLRKKWVNLVKGKNILMEWVRWHDGNKYNEICDEEAVRQKLLFREQNQLCKK